MRLDLCEVGGGCEAQVVVVLQVEPELCGQAEENSEAECCVGCNRALAEDYIVYAG